MSEELLTKPPQELRTAEIQWLQDTCKANAKKLSYLSDKVLDQLDTIKRLKRLLEENGLDHGGDPK